MHSVIHVSWLNFDTVEIVHSIIEMSELEFSHHFWFFSRQNHAIWSCQSCGCLPFRGLFCMNAILASTSSSDNKSVQHPSKCMNFFLCLFSRPNYWIFLQIDYNYQDHLFETLFVKYMRMCLPSFIAPAMVDATIKFSYNTCFVHIARAIQKCSVPFLSANNHV